MFYIFSHIYDMNSVYEVKANVSDQGTYEIATLNVAINDRGCIYPDIVIEEDAKVEIFYSFMQTFLIILPLKSCLIFTNFIILFNLLFFAEYK